MFSILSDYPSCTPFQVECLTKLMVTVCRKHNCTPEQLAVIGTDINMALQQCILPQPLQESLFPTPEEAIETVQNIKSELELTMDRVLQRRNPKPLRIDFPDHPNPKLVEQGHRLSELEKSCKDAFLPDFKTFSGIVEYQPREISLACGGVMKEIPNIWAAQEYMFAHSDYYFTSIPDEQNTLVSDTLPSKTHIPPILDVD